MNADVTILMPAYKAEGFVANAIESVLAQTYRNFRLVISVDPAGDGTEEVCRRYASDSRVILNINPERRGWVGNMNWCLDQVDTPFFAACFHDDTYHPDFVLRTRTALLENPEAEAAFCHMRQVGVRNGVLEHTDMRGTAYERARDRLEDKTEAYGFKSLSRSRLIVDGMRMPEIGDSGFRADWPFIVAQCLAGMFLSVPEVLYSKVFETRTTTSGWHKISPENLARYEAEVQADQIAQVAASDVSNSEKLTLIEMISARKPFFEIGDQVTPARFLDGLQQSMTTFLIARLAGINAGPSDAPLEDPVVETFKARQICNLAQHYMALPDPEAALFHARRAAAHDPDLPGPQIIAARASFNLVQNGDHTFVEAAFRHVRRMTELVPDAAYGWATLAQLEKRAGNLTSAVSHAERAVDCGGPNQESHARLRDRIRALM